MKVSSDSLFHFTGKENGKEILKLILQQGKIGGSYCREVLYATDYEFEYVVPMICFCDIPLKTYFNLEIQTYGNYGIGLSKRWGISHKMNPVLYLERSSKILSAITYTFGFGLNTIHQYHQQEFTEILAKHETEIPSKLNKEINKISKSIAELEIKLDKEAITDETVQSVISIDKKIAKLAKERESAAETMKKLRRHSDSIQNSINYFFRLFEYVKPYEIEKLKRRNGEIIENYRFYDEMEWRYVPNRRELSKCFDIDDVEIFNQWRSNLATKEPLFKIDFKANDIDDIVVESESDVKEFQSFLINMSESPFSSEEREELCKKIKVAEDYKSNH